MKHKIDLQRTADGLITYAAQRLAGFEQHQPDSIVRQPDTRHEWIKDILRGMAAIWGEKSEPLINTLEQRLADMHGCFATETLPTSEQKYIVQSLSRYTAALKRCRGDQRCQAYNVQCLLDDMCVCWSWDACDNGVFPVLAHTQSELLRMVERRPVQFTSILLCGAAGAGGEDFVSGSVTDVDAVRGTPLYSRVIYDYPEVAEWSAACIVYLCGGQHVSSAVTPAEALDLKIIRGEGRRFLERPGVSFEQSHVLHIPVQIQSRK